MTSMRWRHVVLLRCIIALAAVVAVWQTQGYTGMAAPLDFSHPVEHNHFILFGQYGDPQHATTASSAFSASPSARFVQLSNGSGYACDTVSIQDHDPQDRMLLPLGHHMESLVAAMHQSLQPCVHRVVRKYDMVYCWGNEVREDVPSENVSRVLGRRKAGVPQVYWDSTDSFGVYAATVYGSGDACPYREGSHTETEVRFYCRYAEFDNPLPYLTLYESSQCRYVLRLLSSKLCAVPQLAHPREEETVRCQLWRA